MNATFTAFVDGAQETDNDGEVLSLDLPKFAEQLDVLAMKRKEVQSIRAQYWVALCEHQPREGGNKYMDFAMEQMYTGYIADYAVKNLVVWMNSFVNPMWN